LRSKWLRLTITSTAQGLTSRIHTLPPQFVWFETMHILDLQFVIRKTMITTIYNFNHILLTFMMIIVSAITREMDGSGVSVLCIKLLPFN